MAHGIGADTTSAASILKKWYRGPVKYELNDRTWAFKNFKKSSYSWNGSEVIVPIHTGRNSGVGYKAEGGQLPTAGQQQFEHLTIPAKFYYGRFQLTGPAMAKAKSSGQGAFLNLLKTEMDRLVIDVSMNADARAVTGGPVRGLLNEHKANAAQTAAQSNAAPGGGATVWEYSGDYAPFLNVDPTAVAATTWVKVNLIRLDTYELITGGGVNPNIFVTNIPAGIGLGTLAPGQIELTFCSDTAGAPFDTFDTSVVEDGYAIALQVAATQAASAAAPTTMGLDPTVAGFDATPANYPPQFPLYATAGNLSTCLEPEGMLSNLCTQSHFGVARATVGGVKHILQSNMHTMAVGGAQTRTTLTKKRIQQMMDKVLLRSGKEFTILACSPMQRAEYVALLTGLIEVTGQKATKGDAGFVSTEKGGLSYGGLRIWTSQHIPDGMWFFLTLDAWEMATLEGGDFADLDGSILSRVSASDTWEGFWRMYYNTYTASPNCNAVLTGVDLGA